MKRSLRASGYRTPEDSAQSESLKKTEDGNGDTEGGVGKFRMSEGPEAGSNEKAGGNRDGIPANGVLSEFEKSELLGDIEGCCWWEVLHGGRSLAVSAFAGVILIGTDLVDPQGSDPERIYAGLGLYFASLAMICAGERRLLRKQQVLLPPDRFGSGRTALMFAAIVCCLCGAPDLQRLAPWLAFAAVALGGWSDGAWIAIAAERRGQRPWRAWGQLIVGEREARKQCWAVLFGKDGR